MSNAITVTSPSFGLFWGRGGWTTEGKLPVQAAHNNNNNNNNNNVSGPPRSGPAAVRNNKRRCSSFPIHTVSHAMSCSTKSFLAFSKWRAVLQEGCPLSFRMSTEQSKTPWPVMALLLSFPEPAGCWHCTNQNKFSELLPRDERQM
jgi:hypothetical protein